MRKFSKIIDLCTPIVKMIGFLTWDVLAFLLADTVSLIAMVVSKAKVAL